MTLSDVYAVSKSLHLIGMVSWLSGLFYLVRIMVYHAEALAKEEPQRSQFAAQFSVMEWKAYRVILQPAVVITWTFGVLMLCIQPTWLEQGWLHVKLLFVLALTAYTYYCQVHIRRLAAAGIGVLPNHVFYRALNEVPTVLLVGIVFLAVFKQGINWLWWLGGVAAFATLIFNAVRKLNKKR